MSSSGADGVPASDPATRGPGAAAAATPAAAAGAPVPYQVRNTFIDVAPVPEEEPAEGVFNTWHPSTDPGTGAAEASIVVAATTTAPAAAAGAPVPYFVRNTFIDFAPDAGDSSSEGVFNTWHPSSDTGTAQTDIEAVSAGPAPAAGVALATNETASPGRAVVTTGTGPASTAPMLYPVRNTFIDFAPDPGQEEHSEGIFSTWHHPVREEHSHLQLAPGSPGVADGADAADPLLAGKKTAAAPAPAECHGLRSGTSGPSAERGGHGPRAPPSEEGELSEEEEDDEALEDGEVPPSSGAALGASVEAAVDAAPQGASASAVAGAEGSLPSAGSAGHHAGLCRPCAWLHKSAEGCLHGFYCEYCHLCPPGELKRRKQEKMHRRWLEMKQTKMEKAKAAQVEGSTNVPRTEPCYIKVPGLPLPSRASLGSRGHAAGECRPCAWVHKGGEYGCKNGTDCAYCHLCPPGELKRRKRLKWDIREGLPSEPAA